MLKYSIVALLGAWWGPRGGIFMLLRQVLRCSAVASGAFALGLASLSGAQAHVKWFCAYSVAGQPEGLGNVLCQDFELLTVTAVAALMLGALVDRSFVGEALNRALDRVFSLLRTEPDVMVRAGVGVMMVGAAMMGGIILTPELTTTSPFVPVLQLLIAACLFTRRTLPISALGLASLYITALVQYGAFHLADYPVFLGVSAYLAAVGLGRSIFGARPLDVLRWSVAVTLMWASIEKWAYPGWSFPLFVSHPGMALGFDPAFYMRAAGTVEFALAFALLLTPFSRRCAAIMLSAIFISAIPAFGQVDAVGHAGVIGVLFALMLDTAKRRPRTREIVALPFGFGASLAAVLSLYYVAHAALYGTTIL